MKRIFAIFLSTLFILPSILPAGDFTAMQYIFSIKKVIPEAQEVHIFLPADIVEAEKPKVERVAAQQQINATIFIINDSRDIGQAFKDMPDNSVLLVYPSDVLMDKSSKLFILKKCKEKQISVVTSSQDYTDSGALIGLLKDENNRTKIVVNLKHSEYLAAHFTDEFVSQAGIAEIIR